jgi:hypothetical protein
MAASPIPTHSLAQTPAAQLRDIKPPVAIPDWSAWFYWGVIVLGIIILIIALYFLIKTLLGMRRTNRRKAWLAALQAIDWNDPKHAAYEATRLGRLLLPEDDEKSRLHELYRQMVAELEKYKYKKTIDPLDPATRSQVDLFVRGCDESL